jgi:hypothetical protein
MMKDNMMKMLFLFNQKYQYGVQNKDVGWWMHMEEFKKQAKEIYSW